MPASQMGPCGNVPQWTLLGQEKGCVRGGGRQSDSCHCLGGHAHVRVCVCARARHSLDLLLWGSEHPDEVIFRTEAVSLVPLALWVLWCQ